jgi:hypothetical protein
VGRQAAVAAERRALLGHLERGLRPEREAQQPDLAGEREDGDAEDGDGDEPPRRGRA